MKDSMKTKLSQLARRLEEIDALLASQDTARDINTLRGLGQERAEIEPVVARFHDYNRARADELSAQEMLAEPEMKALAEEEIHAARARIESLEADLQRLLLPRDPNDERNVFLEVRAGTGGDESALFAGELLRMYLRYAERNRWKTEILSESASDLGGYKEVIVRIEGQGAYSKLKFESGGHRVQRVPETEAQGRIHTSACTVAVLPAGTAGAKGVDAQFGGVELHLLGLVRLGHHGHRAGAGVDATLALGGRHALYAVTTGFEAQLAVGAGALDAQHDLLVAAELGCAFAHDLGAQAGAFTPAQVHARQVAG
jgi:hypothetical protein